MSTKYLVLFGLLAVIFGACSSEEAISSSNHHKEINQDQELTSFVSGKDGGDVLKTRTSLNYNDGNFFWETGDKITVKDETGTWEISSNEVKSHASGFKFEVPGVYYASKSYPVLYTGKNGNDNQVTIATSQKQVEPNTTLHFNEAGDCGFGQASLDLDNPSRFKFKLDHKPAYLVFQPYTNNKILKDCFITKIEVTATDGSNIAGTYTLDPVTGNLIGSGNSKTISLTTGNVKKDWWNYPYLPYVKGFPLNNTSASVATNGAYMVIAPGIHSLRVDYWVKDYTTAAEGVITKTLPSFNYDTNNFYDMTASLDVPDYPRKYYYWDTKKNMWNGHEWDSAAPWQPTVNGRSDARYPKPTDLDTYGNHGMTSISSPLEASNSCRDCPTVNEMLWYVNKGDPHVDNSIWTAMGHLYSGGVWLKKKAKIAHDEGLTEEMMKNQYLGKDFRKYGLLNWYTNGYYGYTGWPDVSNVLRNGWITKKVTDLSSVEDYFFLPVLGRYIYGSLSNIGVFGDYFTSSVWSSSGGEAHAAFKVGINYDPERGIGLNVGIADMRSDGGLAEPTWFK